MFKDTLEAVTEQFTTQSVVPKVKFTKNGYEIRQEVLAMAKDAVVSEYNAKVAEAEFSMKKDKKTGEIVTSVQFPQYPGVQEILEAAEKFYSFVEKK
jgi:hypothetical protein